MSLAYNIFSRALYFIYLHTFGFVLLIRRPKKWRSESYDKNIKVFCFGIDLFGRPMSEIKFIIFEEFKF